MNNLLSLNKRIVFEPEKETIYPDKGGYTGFSICVWNISHTPLDKVSFSNQWGRFHPDRIMGNKTTADCLLEGRFFVFGSLLNLVLELRDDKSIVVVHDRIFEVWKPLMDEIVSKETLLWKEEERQRIHIDEIVNDSLRNRVSNTGFRSWNG